MPRDYTPSKQLNSKLSLDTHKRIETLIKEHGYTTQRQVIESAVEALFEVVTSLNFSSRVDTSADDKPTGTLNVEALAPVDYGMAKGETLRATKVDKETVRASGFARTIRQKGDGKR